MPRPSQKHRRSKPRLPQTVEVCERRTLLTAFGGFVNEIPEINGWGNNELHPEWGTVNAELLRMADADYGDGFYTPAGADRPSARAISNAVVEALTPKANSRHLTDVLWLWGQFMDHDLDLTEPPHEMDHLEPFNVPVPIGDPHFDPFFSGDQVIGLNRSAYQIDENGVRQHVNQLTAFLDASVIYGSDEARAMELREGSGGRLKVSAGNLLPYNVNGFPNGGGPSPTLFLAGDVRVNENIALIAMHTLWVREHNRIAGEIADQDDSLSDEEIYQQARAIVRAELQVITYNEFLPALLGSEAISPYRGYKRNVNPNIATEFSTAAYRFGHTLLSSELMRVDANGVNDPILLRHAFFNPGEIADQGIDSILRGVTMNVAQELDNEIVDDVRNFLFGPPGAGGFDLASLNIQRGRDHGLPSYNDTREALGLGRLTSFSQISSQTSLQARLASVYESVDDIDLWVGGLAEDHLHGSSMGETFTAIISDQFERLRDGDRFWYQNVFRGPKLRELESTTLAAVIERNTGIEGLQESVFFAPGVFHVDLRSLDARDVTVYLKEDRVDVVDNRTRRVLVSRELEGLEQIVLVGSNGRPDKITFGYIPEGVLSGGIEIQAGEGGGDILQFLETHAGDRISINRDRVTINGVVIKIGGIDQIRIQAHGGDDIEIEEDMDLPVTVSRGRGAHSHPIPHNVHHALEKVFSTDDLLEGLVRGRNSRGR